MSDKRAILFHTAVVADLLDALLERYLAPAHLTAREFEIATVLATRGAMPPGEIATVTGVPAPSVSRVLGRMEERGLVAHADNPADGRSRIARLTEEGAAAFEEARQAFDVLYEAVATHLGSELSLTDAAIHRLEWALRTVAGIDVPAPLEQPRATSHLLHYAGPPLGLDEEAEVLDYIGWVRKRTRKGRGRNG